MGLKEAWKALVKKENDPAPIPADSIAKQIVESDLFPIVKIPESQLQQYKKVPLASIGVLGTAFSRLPDGAKQIVGTKSIGKSATEKVYVACNPKNASGIWQQGKDGLTGNIVNADGKITGRLQFQEKAVPSTIPMDPTMMVVATALMAIEQKLDKIQESVEDILHFLELEKQSKQRGNLKMLGEIADDFKIHYEDASFCQSRDQIVQQIQMAALQDIEFYQEKVSSELQKQKTLHLFKDANTMLYSVTHEFAEYQLACYLYSYCGFLDVMLRKDFSSQTLSKTADKMLAVSQKYSALFADCRSEIEKYQISSVESKLLDGAGTVVTGLGKMIGSIPKIKDGTVDEKLIEAGKTIGEKKQQSVADKLEAIVVFEDSKMSAFIENIRSIDTMCNVENAILTDGEQLYVLETVVH